MKYADRLKAVAAGADASVVTLGSASAPMYRTLAQVIATGKLAVGDVGTEWFVEDDLGNWESGLYTITNNTTITRQSVLSSSNSDAAAVFPNGVKRAWMEPSANSMSKMVKARTDANGATLALVGPDGQDIPTGGGGGGSSPTVTSTVAVTTVSEAVYPLTGAFVAYPAQACTELVITNRTGVDIDYARNSLLATAPFVTIRNGCTRRIVGITDASQIAIRRNDWRENAPALRKVSVAANAVTSTEIFTGVSIINQTLANGGGGNSLSAAACTAAEIINNSPKDFMYRHAAGEATLRLAAGSSAVVVGITNASQIFIQAFDMVQETTNFRPVQVEIFGTGLRERLNHDRPQVQISEEARVVVGSLQASSSFPTRPDLTIGEVARGPRRSLFPKRIFPLAQFTTGSALVGGPASGLADATDGEIIMGLSQIEFTQAAAGTYVFAPAAVTTPIDTTNGIIRTTCCWPTGPGTANYKTAGLTWFKLQIFSSGSPAAPPADYHEVALWPSSFGGLSTAKRNMSTAVNTSNFTAVGAGANLSAITWARYVLVTTSGGNGAQFRPGPIEFIPNALNKAIVIFSVDDFNMGAWTNLLPALSKYGYPAVMAADATWALGTYQGMTADQIRILHQHYGWQIVNQNWHWETTNYMSNEQMLVEHSKFNLAMMAIGVGNLEDTSYGGGPAPDYISNFRDDNRPALKRMYRSCFQFIQGGNTTPPLALGETAPFGDPYNIKRMNMSAFTAGTLQQRWQDHVQQAINNKGVAFFGAHNEFNISNGNGEAKSAIGPFVEWLRTQELAGNLEVLTLAQAIDKIYPV